MAKLFYKYDEESKDLDKAHDTEKLVRFIKGDTKNDHRRTA